MEGMKFACQPGCTNCCRETGYVYLSEEDLKRAARFLGITRKAFESKFVYRTRRLIRLRKPAGSQCHFLLDGGCAIHPAKPTQCRAYPFWPELVESRGGWSRTATVCPGIGKGTIVPVSAILRATGQMREAYPTMYD